VRRRGRTIAFAGPEKGLELHDHDVPDPGPGELLLRVTHAGVCGTDAHRLSGDLPPPPGPICFGHEGVGVVEALGAGITHDRAGAPLAEGDRVAWSPPTPCGQCPGCRAGQTTALCPNMVWPAPFGATTSASYQDYATVRSSAAFFRVPDDTSSEAAIAFGCAMPTALGGLMRLGHVRDMTVVVQGSGPVGLATCVAALDAGASAVVVIGDPPARLDVAKRLGALETLALSTTTPEQRLERVRELTGGAGAPVVVEAAGHISAFGEGLGLVAVGGRYLVLGLYSGRATTPVNPVEINNRQLTVLGSLGGPLAAYQGAVEIAARQGRALDFDSLVTDRFPLDRTADAIEHARRGEATKVVVTP
jgi:threonine dehydrogenase-like Zn-dependent dehydrogenase